MYNKKSSILKHIDFLLLDLLCLTVSFLIPSFVRLGDEFLVENGTYLNILLWAFVPNIIYYILFNPYHDVIRRSKVDEIKLSLYHVVINFLFVVSILFVLQIDLIHSRFILSYTYFFYFLSSTIIRIVWKMLILKGIVKMSYEEMLNTLLICKKENALRTIININNSDYNRHYIKGVYLIDDDDLLHLDQYSVVRKMQDIHSFVVDNNINVVFVSSELSNDEKREIRRLIDEGIEIQLYIDSIFGIEAEDKEISNIGMYQTLQLNSYSFSSSQKFYFFFKRLMDIVISMAGCLILIPVFVIIKVAFFFSGDKEPIIYKQSRIGLNGKEFDLYKFRSMVPNADEVLKELLKDRKLKEEWDAKQKFDQDPRITKVGYFIRKTSIDELPQMINVFKGDMSLIGPRPLVPGELKSKNGIKLYERIKPGITGWWACHGRSDMSYEERLEHEYYYVRNCSLYLDIICVLRTIYVVILGKGAK